MDINCKPVEYKALPLNHMGTGIFTYSPNDTHLYIKCNMNHVNELTDSFVLRLNDNQLFIVDDIEVLVYPVEYSLDIIGNKRG